MRSSVRYVLGVAVAAVAVSPATAQVVVNVSTSAGLQAAINSATDGTIIQVATGTYPSPAGGFLISNRGAAFTIRAATGASVTLDGQGTWPVLRFLNSTAASGGPVTFERLTFAHGYSAASGTAGGVTMVRARATFVDCVFQSNGTSAGGGGTAVLQESVAHFLRASWIGNSARTYGGALAMAGPGTDVTIHESQFLGNRTNLPNHPDSAGGAIRLTNTSGMARLRVTSTRFEGNEAGYVAGALYAYGGWQNPISTPTADVIVANCLFINNKAQRDPSVSGAAPTEGGALHAENQVTIRVYNSRFVTNSADNGGAVSVYRADVEIEKCTFLGNRAVGTASSAMGFGGGISIVSNDTAADGAVNYRSSKLTVRDSLLQGRYGAVTTTAQTAGCLYASGDNNRLYGLSGVSQGGTAATNRATVSISGSVFDDCDVAETLAATGKGGAAFLDLVALSLSDSIVISSDALPGSTDGQATGGGGLAIINQSSATISDSMLAKNTAGCSGGALLALGASVVVDGCHLVKNGVTGTSACGNGRGGTMYSGPIPASGSVPDLPVSGEVRDSVLTEGTGAATMIWDADSTDNANLINTVVYNNNQLRNSGTSIVYRNTIAGEYTVAGLNSLVVTRGVGGSTDKSPDSNNTWPNPYPVVGKILAVPPDRLSSAAPAEGVPTGSFLGYAWGGASTATVNGSVRTGNAGLTEVTADGLQTLVVSSSTFSTTVGTLPAPVATLVANPPGIDPGDSAQLLWTAEGSFLETSIDQGVGRSVFSSGIAVVTPAATTTYRHFASTQEGGAVAAATVTLCSAIVVDPWAIPAATAGSDYRQAFTRTGGSGAVTWALSGTLPTGLTFGAGSGLLSGTPAQTGNFPFTVTVTDASGCSGSRGYTLTVGPAGPFEAAALALDAAGNSILEPGETPRLSPAWRNSGGTAESLTGTLTSFSGPGSSSYTIPDATAGYGTIAPGATAGCAEATGDCYRVQVSVPASRPAVHWDSMARETLSNGQIRDWIVHVGDSFDDVPRTSGFYPFIETLLHRSVTSGCGGTSYCPSESTTREQMAVFTLRAKEGADYRPPTCGGSPVFADVPVSSAFCPWVQELARRGVVGGCGGGNYCPDEPVKRKQMPVFVLKTLDPNLTPPACQTPIFADLPAANPFCAWVQELARRGVVGGCGGGNYCPENPVTREQMGVFIGAGFGLSLYGP